jgi:hypothetical protein
MLSDEDALRTGVTVVRGAKVFSDVKAETDANRANERMEERFIVVTIVLKEKLILLNGFCYQFQNL